MKTTKWFKFHASGPHVFKEHVLRNKKGVKHIDRKAFKKWLATLPFADSRGVYVFATGEKKPKPWYVGLTAKNSFKSECGSKEALINKMIQGASGSPVLFLLVAPPGWSSKIDAAIDSLETELMRACHWINPELLNTNKKIPTWETFIPGVLRTGAGKPSPAAKALRTALRIS